MRINSYNTHNNDKWCGKYFKWLKLPIKSSLLCWTVSITSSVKHSQTGRTSTQVTKNVYSKDENEREKRDFLLHSFALMFIFLYYILLYFFSSWVMKFLWMELLYHSSLIFLCCSSIPLFTPFKLNFNNFVLVKRCCSVSLLYFPYRLLLAEDKTNCNIFVYLSSCLVEIMSTNRNGTLTFLYKLLETTFKCLCWYWPWIWDLRGRSISRELSSDISKVSEFYLTVN